jgi:hypothetical protein
MPQYTRQRLEDHDCDGAGKIQMPKEDALRFKNAHRMLKVPYMVSNFYYEHLYRYIIILGLRRF